MKERDLLAKNAADRLSQLRDAEGKLRAEVISETRPNKNEVNALNRIQQKLFKAEMLVERLKMQLRKQKDRTNERLGIRARLEALAARIEELPAGKDA